MKVRVKPKPSSISLSVINDEWRECTKCPGIGRNARHKVFIDTIPKTVLAFGLKDPIDIVMIGEGPGIVEDVNGTPFTGPSGQLLRRAIKDVLYKCPNCGVADYYSPVNGCCVVCKTNYNSQKRPTTTALTNLLLCRPYSSNPRGTGNRAPREREIENCFPRLISTLIVLKPKVIVALGSEAQHYLGTIRKALLPDLNCSTAHLYHPSYVSRSGGIGSPKYWEYVDSIKTIFECYERVHR